MQKHYDLTVNLLCVLAPIMIYSHIINCYGHISQWTEYENWYTVGTIRACAGVLLGVFAYIIGENFIKEGRKTKFLLRMCKIICIVAVCSLVTMSEYITYNDEIVYPYIFALSVLSVYYTKSIGGLFKLGRISLNKVSRRINKMYIIMGDLSYYIFLIQYGVCNLLKKYLPGNDYKMMVSIYFIAIFLTAFLLKGILLLYRKASSNLI